MKKLKNFFNRFKILFKNLTLNYTGRLFTILSAFHIALYIAKQQVPTFSLVLVPASIFPFVSAVKDCLDCRKCPYPTITKSLKKGSWMKKSICYNLARRFWGAFLPDISLEGSFFWMEIMAYVRKSILCMQWYAALLDSWMTNYIYQNVQYKEHIAEYCIPQFWLGLTFPVRQMNK